MVSKDEYEASSERPKAEFSHVDKNNDGVIDKHELRAAYKKEF